MLERLHVVLLGILYRLSPTAQTIENIRIEHTCEESLGGLSCKYHRHRINGRWGDPRRGHSFMGDTLAPRVVARKNEEYHQLSAEIDVAQPLRNLS